MAPRRVSLYDSFERSQLEARTGAKIVFWPEGAAVMWEEDEIANIERGRELARQEGVRTIYSIIGDLFAWLCVAGFVFVVGWAVVRRTAGR